MAVTQESRRNSPRSDLLVLVAIQDEALWNEIAPQLEGRFRVRREVDGLRAIDVLLLLKPAALIAETGLPSLSGILLARLIGHNRYLTKLPVGLICSRQYLIEEFWAKESGAVSIASRNEVMSVVTAIEAAVAKSKPLPDEDWEAAEGAMQSQGGPAAAAANELERQLIGASIMARLGEIETTAEPNDGEIRETIPTFIGQALGALASVLEFAQAAITLFDSGSMYTVDNEVFAGTVDHNCFIRETQASCALYTRPDMPGLTLAPTVLPPVRHELPGPRQPASTFFALPLTGRRGIYGLLSMMTYKQIAMRGYYLHTLSMIGSQLAVNLERAIFYEEVRLLSVTDPLTALSNRRAVISRLEFEFRRSIRYRSPFSIAICDLDDFKLVNDHHGHQAGDAMLKAVASILRNCVREIDLAGRWGGEEMALLFPETDFDGARIACERVAQQVRDLRLDFEQKKLSITLSIGMATLNPQRICPRSPGSMIGLADRAMYLAKSRGKNRVVSFLELPEIHQLPE